MSKDSEFLTLYASMWDFYNNAGISKELNPKDVEYSGNFLQYIQIGIDALRLCVNALMDNNLRPPKKILDFPSGSGRALRHFKSYFCDADLTACDINEDHLEFCFQQFGANIVKSQTDFSKLHFQEKYDLIFCGSLLTHLPHSQFLSFLGLLKRSLSDDGIAVVTLEGRFTIFAQENKWKFLKDSLFQKAKSEYLTQGYGFVDYKHNFKNLLSMFEDKYGFALTSPAYMSKQIFKIEGLRLVGYKEKAWYEHQDVCIIQRKNIFI